jgi:prepilin-type N-terminal cleavage/methylation domain-containing protein
MSVGRRGFTLVELIIALVLMTLVGTVIFQLLNGTQRVSTAQSERMMLQSSIRTGALVVPRVARAV